MTLAWLIAFLFNLGAAILNFIIVFSLPWDDFTWVNLVCALVSTGFAFWSLRRYLKETAA